MIKQYHKLAIALGTETTINDTTTSAAADCTTSPLRQVGFAANRRLLDVQPNSHDPMVGGKRLASLPVTVVGEPMVSGLRLGDPTVRGRFQAPWPNITHRKESENSRGYSSP